MHAANLVDHGELPEATCEALHVLQFHCDMEDQVASTRDAFSISTPSTTMEQHLLQSRDYLDAALDDLEHLLPDDLDIKTLYPDAAGRAGLRVASRGASPLPTLDELELLLQDDPPDVQCSDAAGHAGFLVASRAASPLGPLDDIASQCFITMECEERLPSQPAFALQTSSTRGLAAPESLHSVAPQDINDPAADWGELDDAAVSVASVGDMVHEQDVILQNEFAQLIYNASPGWPPEGGPLSFRTAAALDHSTVRPQEEIIAPQVKLDHVSEIFAAGGLFGCHGRCSVGELADLGIPAGQETPVPIVFTESMLKAAKSMYSCETPQQAIQSLVKLTTEPSVPSWFSSLPGCFIEAAEKKQNSVEHPSVAKVGK
jgi:hypothetical protein